MSEATRPATQLSPEQKREMLALLLKERARRVRSFPVSFAQQRLWLLDRLEPGNIAYNISRSIRLVGNLSVDALRRAFTEVVRRHEALRTTFGLSGEQAVQVVNRPAPFELQYYDLGGLDAKRRRAEQESLTVAEARWRFDLSKGPLLRASLLRLSAEEHVLTLTMHHIIADGWSGAVLLRELGALYAAFCDGRESPLAELPIQYADYAVWQHEWLSGSVLEEYLGYWSRQLEGAPPLLKLPTDRPRPHAQSFRGKHLAAILPPALSDALRGLSRQEGATLFMTLLAAFKVLLYRQTGQPDVVVGTPIAGRNRKDLEALIGFFVNTLVLRTSLAGRPTFRELLRRVREVCLGAYAHQEMPFEKLVEELQPERSTSHTPLFQVFFNMHSHSEGETVFPGLAAHDLPAPEASAKFDLTLYAKDHLAGIQLTLVYNSDLFERPRMVELFAQLRHLLSQAAQRPDEKITSYTLLTERSAVLLPDPTRALGPRREAVAQQLFSERARLSPASLAVADAHVAWSYAELEEQGNRLARLLLDGRVRTGDVVAVYAHRSASLVWAILGILKAGAAFMILDPAHPAARLAECVRLARPRGWLRLEAAGEVAPELEECLDGLGCRTRLTLGDSTAHDGTTHAGVNLLDGLSAEPPGVEVGQRDVAYIAFTSGSTGRPKGVRGTHDSLTHYHAWLARTFSIGERDRFSMLSGLSHDPLLRDIFPPLLLGAALCVPEGDVWGTPGGLAGWMERERITVTNLTPALGQLLSEWPEGAAAPALDSLRYAFFVGDVLTGGDLSRLRRLAPSVTCFNLYGTTETQRSLSYYAAHDTGTDDESALEGPLPVGRGIDGVQLLVLNETLGLAGVGEVGELYLRSPHLSAGYLEDEGLTRERFVVNPFTGEGDDRLYRTGDLGRYSPDGNVEILGRADRQLKIRGFRVEPGEIEAALKRLPGVRECVVLKRADGREDGPLVGYVGLEAGAMADASKLRGRLKRELPDYMIPSAFVFMERLPLTPGGKIDRGALPPPDEAHPDGGEFAAPRTTVEESLAGIWRQLLGVERIGLNDNFFELGGHSLLAMRILLRVREQLEAELPLRLLFEAPTLAEFAAAVELALGESRGLRAEPIKPVPRGVQPPVSLIQEGWLFREWWEEVHSVARRSFHTAATFRLAGPLDQDILARALAEIVQRHEVLRSTFPPTGGLLSQKKLYPLFVKIFGMKGVQKKLYQLDGMVSEAARPKFLGGPRVVIKPHVEVPLRVEDLSAAGESEREAEVLRLLAGESERPFDYAAGPLLRAAVLKLAPEEHVVSVVLHHLVSDGWSMQLFTRELFELYRAFASGTVPRLPELHVQYGDYADWQRRWFRGETLRAVAAFWKEQFEGVGLFPELTLPFARKAPPASDFQQRVDVQSLMLPRELSGSLRELGHRAGVTRYMLFLAALGTLLHRYTGREKIGVFSPLANRSRPETQNLIGWFANIHVLAADCSGDPRFSELLKRVRGLVLSVHAHQEVPYVLLVKTVLPLLKGYETPKKIFEAPHVFFDYVVRRRGSQRVAGLNVTALHLPPRSTEAGVEVKVIEEDEDLTVTARYSTDRYEPADIRRMLARFRALLEAAAADPGRPIGALLPPATDG